MTWNFFEIGHGKGEWDGAGAVVKRALRTEQLHNPSRKLQDAKDVVEFLQESMSGLVQSSLQSKRTVSYRHFYNIKPDDVDRTHVHGCDTIPGSRNLHSIHAVSPADPTLLMVRELSCYCAPCIDSDWQSCENASYVKSWRVVKLAPTNVSFVRDQMLLGPGGGGNPSDEEPWDYESDDESLGGLVNIGDNFVVPAIQGNEEGVEFYILQCQKERQLVRENFKCVWGGEFERGQYVLAGTYYQKWGNSEKSFVYLRNSQLAYIDADLVLACKFNMLPALHRVKGDDPVYQLTNESIQVIRTSLQGM